MSIDTVRSLSNEWHQAAAINRKGGYYEFPEPWAQAGKVSDNDIVPITNSLELYREGHAMHHCVGTYGKRICAGLCYIFSLRKEGIRIATIKLVQSEGRVSMGQIRGPHNAPVTDETKRAARKWLKSQHTFRLPPVIHLADDDDFDFDLDFE